MCTFFPFFFLFVVGGGKCYIFFLDPAVGVCEYAVINRTQFFCNKNFCAVHDSIQCIGEVWYHPLDGFENGNANVHC